MKKRIVGVGTVLIGIGLMFSGLRGMKGSINNTLNASNRKIELSKEEEVEQIKDIASDVPNTKDNNIEQSSSKVEDSSSKEVKLSEEEEVEQMEDTASDVLDTNDNNVEQSTSKVKDSVSNKKGVIFNIISVEDNSSIGDESYMEYSTDNNFIIININIENQSDESYDVNALNFKLIADDKEYAYYPNAVTALKNVLWIDNINPGISKEYTAVYETPFVHTDKDCQLKILNNSMLSDKGISINLN